MTTAWQESWPAPRVSCCSRCASRASSWNRASCEPRVTVARTSSSWSSWRHCALQTPCSAKRVLTTRAPAGRPGLDRGPAGRDQGVRRGPQGGLGGPRRPVGEGALSAGAVARPAMRSTLWTGRRPTVAAREPGTLRLAVSRSRPPEFVTRLAERLGAARAHGLCRHQGLLRHRRRERRLCPRRRAVRVGLGGTGGRGWAAGLHTSRIDGSPLVYNRPTRSCPTCSSAAPRWPTRS